MRDCDMCESSSVESFKNYYRYRMDEIHEMEYADGPIDYQQISYKEYNKRKYSKVVRDRMLEAYENGMGTLIYI